MRTCLLNAAYRDNDPIILGGIAQNGCYFSTKEGASISGYDRDVSGRLHELADGAIFVDKRPIAEHADFVKWIVRDPHVDVHLPLDGYEPIDREAAAMMSLAVTGAWAHLLNAAASGSSLLDSESVDRYVARWTARGARIGVRHGDTIKWAQRIGGALFETVTSEEEIPECRCWESVCLGCRKMRYWVDREPNTGWEVKVRKPSDPNDHCPDCKAEAARRAPEV